MMPAPRTVFGQLALVMGLVLAGALLLSALLGRELATRPAASQLLQAIDRFAGIVEQQARTQPHAQVVRQLREGGLQVRETEPTGGPVRRWRTGPLLRELQAQAGRQLGAGRVLHVVEDGSRTRLWVGLATARPLWVAFDFERRRQNVRRFSVALLAGCTVLVWLAAGYFARRLALPLQRLAQAAPALVRGESPPGDGAGGPREVRALAQALAQASGDVRRAAEERALMLAGISHDLRTPLTRLQYALELVPGTDAGLRQGMQRDIAEIDAILSQFIAYARDGRDEPSEQTDLAELCRGAVAATTMPWTLELPASAPMRGKPMALLRAVENLVANAERHGASPFALSLSREGDAWRVEVRDGGHGLTPEQARRVRQPFVHDGAGGGTGLGLAIVDGVAQRHGGELRLSPNTPRGLRAVLVVRDA